MTLEEFKDLSGWSEGLDRFAEYASEVTDHDLLRQAARDYLQAEDKLNDILEALGVELG